MPRPKLTERITLRIPEELLLALAADAMRRDCSLNEVAICAFENELARLYTYRLDFYGQLIPLALEAQGVNVTQRHVNV